MLHLPRPFLDQVYAHGEQTFPAECCGLLLGGIDGGDRIVVEVIPAANLRAAEANDRYEIGTEDRQRAEQRARIAGLAVVGFYHSHPDHDAYFSPTDLACSEEYQWGEPWVPPTYAYLVVSIHRARRDHAKAFLVVEGRAVEEGLTLSD